MTRKPLELTSTMIPRRTPAPAEAATEPLNFKITPTMKRRFRMAAARADMKLTELLGAMLDDWERAHMHPEDAAVDRRYAGPPESRDPR